MGPAVLPAPVSPNDPPPSTHYRYEPLGDGAFFARARREGTALSNAGIVDLGDATAVFDTGLTLRSARDLRKAAERITGRAPTLAVNSHWHLDHVLGNQVFGSAPIHATRRTLDILRDRSASLSEELRPESLREETRELTALREAAGSPEAQAIYAPVLRIREALLEESAERRLTVPTLAFENERRLPSERGARLLSFGSGHTESDAVLFLERDRLLFAGDLVVVGQHPNTTSGDPAHWVEVLRELDRLRPERIVPGHGPMATSEALGEIQGYLEDLLELAAGRGAVRVPSRYAGWAEPEQFEENLRQLRGDLPGDASRSA